VTYDNFNIYMLCVASLHRKMTPFFSQFHNVKIPMSHFRQFLRWWYCHRSCFLQSV